MAKVKDRIVRRGRDGAVEIEYKDGFVVAHPKTQEQTRDLIMEYVEALSAEIDVERAILTGSYARERPREWDYIDVVIISPYFESISNGVDRRSFLNRRASKVHTWLSPRGYTADEYDNRSSELGLGYYKRTGKVIYDKNGG